MWNIQDTFRICKGILRYSNMYNKTDGFIIWMLPCVTFRSCEADKGETQIASGRLGRPLSTLAFHLPKL